MTRRTLFAFLLAVLAVTGSAGGESANTDSLGSMRRPLEPLPLGAIRPTGWLRTQLQIQAEGLTGHLDEFWPDVKESGWIGGEAEGWPGGGGGPCPGGGI